MNSMLKIKIKTNIVYNKEVIDFENELRGMSQYALFSKYDFAKK